MDGRGTEVHHDIGMKRQSVVQPHHEHCPARKRPESLIHIGHIWISREQANIERHREGLGDSVPICATFTDVHQKPSWIDGWLHGQKSEKYNTTVMVESR